jgi:thiol-disulfide isomerase/thioredoxin
MRVLSSMPNIGTVDSATKPLTGGILYLSDGDRIPCESTEIDDEGVHFKSSVVEATLVPHGQVKALEFIPQWTAAALDDVKRQRLLTLPRMQKANPPTHLIVSRSGDYLRTKLDSMNDETLSIESHLEPKQIARSGVACVIWLHATSDAVAATPDDGHPASDEHSPRGLRVQAVKTDGVRLTFQPQACSGKSLSGTGELLGPCSVDLNQVDSLIFGSAIRNEAAEAPFQLWKLTDAIEPRYLRDSAEGGGTRAPTGESDLVGKIAPDVRLALLGGGRFNLAELKGHVVVLDFWASWCGPCMQAMPQVDAAVEEYADRGVKLVAVNMQEDQTAASGALERLKIHPAVALDVDGAAAEHYQVTAIPQTVVIDAEGKVAQVFVGSGDDLSNQIRAAIKKLLPASLSNSGSDAVHPTEN